MERDRMIITIPTGFLFRESFPADHIFYPNIKFKRGMLYDR